eukprot:1227728-Pleurochrysis_carterae.AAC.3
MAHRRQSHACEAPARGNRNKTGIASGVLLHVNLLRHSALYQRATLSPKECPLPEIQGKVRPAAADASRKFFSKQAASAGASIPHCPRQPWWHALKPPVALSYRHGTLETICKATCAELNSCRPIYLATSAIGLTGVCLFCAHACSGIEC